MRGAGRLAACCRDRCGRWQRLAGRGVAWALLVVPRLPTVDCTAGFSSEGGVTSVLASAVRELRGAPSEVVSATGWRDVPLPRWLAGAWLLLAIVVALAAVARTLGARRRTALLLLATVGPTAFTVGAVAVLNPVGASAQGRYVLPCSPRLLW